MAKDWGKSVGKLFGTTTRAFGLGPRRRMKTLSKRELKAMVRKEVQRKKRKARVSKYAKRLPVKVKSIYKKRYKGLKQFEKV